MEDPRDGYEHTKPQNYISVGKESFVQGAFGDVIDAWGADSSKRSLMSAGKKNSGSSFERSESILPLVA